MNTRLRFWHKPAVLALLVLVGGLFVLNWTALNFLTDVEKDRGDMVASLRHAQMPQPELTPIYAGFEQVASEINDMAGSIFVFVSVALVVAFVVRRKKPSNPDTEPPPKGELNHGPVA